MQPAGIWLPPLAWVAAAFALGIGLEPHLAGPIGWPHLLAAGLAVAAGLGGLSASRRSAGRWAAALLLGALVPGGLLYAAARSALPPSAVARLAAASPDEAPQSHQLIGLVRDEVPGTLPRRYLVQVESAAGQVARGLVLVRENAPRPARDGATATAGAGSRALPLHYGERVQLDGVLRLPEAAGNPGEFDYAAYLRSQGVQALLTARQVRPLGRVPLWRRWTGVFVSLRARLESVLKAALPPDQAGLLAGILFGSRGDLPVSIAEDFRLAGIYHILAVSGSNVAFVAMPVLALLARLLGRRRALLGTALVVLAYVLLTGAGASVVRAGVMAVLVLAAEGLGRPGGGLPALSAAVLAILVLNPGSLQDPGFQLSVLATGGILLLAGPLRQRLSALPAWAGAALAVTLAAQIAVLPLSLVYWNGISLVSLLANLLVAPLVEGLVFLGSALVALGLLHPALGRLAAVPTAWLLRLLTGGTHLLAGLPLAFLRVSPPPAWEVVGYYLAVFLAFGFTRWRRRRHYLAVLLIGLTTLRLVPGPTRLEATFLDVGQGDAAVLRLPDGRWLLVDGGGQQEGANSGGWDPGAQVLVPYLERLGVRHIDIVLATHPHADHVAGLLAVVQRFSVGELWWGSNPPDVAHATAYGGLMEATKKQGIALRQVHRGERLHLGSVTVTVLGPPGQPYSGQRSDENANSVAVLLTYGRTRLLLAADIEGPVEEDILRSGLLGPDGGVTLLKVGHHGSRYASTAAWLNRLQPAAAVVSVGANSFGHPARDTLARLNQSGALVLRTDRDGAVLFRSNGDWAQVRAYRARGPWRTLLPAAPAAPAATSVLTPGSAWRFVTGPAPSL